MCSSDLPWLKIVGSLLLFWIGVKLLVPEDDDAEIEASTQLLSAIKTILIADLVMSLDNVIAVAAAAGGSILLLILGLAISIPLVIFGATLLLKLMERFPVIITIGGALIGWVAGEMLVTDPILGTVHKHLHIKKACSQWLPRVPMNVYPKLDSLASESHGLNLSFPTPELEEKRQRRRKK